MSAFFASNPGLSSRVAHHIEFAEYSVAELAEIAELMLARDHYAFDTAARAAFAEYLDLRVAQPQFANARSIRNALERARLRQANRLVQTGGAVTRDDLMTLTEPDIRASRVFGAAASTDD
jgi:hypothetical protein